MSKQIPLTQGKVAIVDDDDYEWLMQWKWCARLSKGSCIWYACRKEKIDGRQHQQQMHRLILNAPRGVLVDHKNGDGLDNRRVNIRLATNQQNCMNRVMNRNRIGFKGVSKNSGTSFMAQIRVDGRLIYLGSYSGIVEAAKAYNEAAIKYFGEFARLNILPK